MIADLQEHHPTAYRPTIVLDAGIATEDNLKLIKKKGYRYVCISLTRLKAYQLNISNTQVVLTDRGNYEVKLCLFQPSSEGFENTWLQVESEQKKTKEQSMNTKLQARFLEEVQQIREGLHKKGGTKKIEKVYQRIGRVKKARKDSRAI